MIPSDFSSPGFFRLPRKQIELANTKAVRKLAEVDKNLGQWKYGQCDNILSNDDCVKVEQ